MQHLGERGEVGCVMMDGVGIEGKEQGDRIQGFDGSEMG